MRIHEMWNALKFATHGSGSGIKRDNPMPGGAPRHVRRNLAEEAKGHGHTRTGWGARPLTPHRKAF